MTAVDSNTSIGLDNGWTLIKEKGFKPLELVLDAGRDYRTRHGQNGPQAWGEIYTLIYRMCIQRDPPGALSQGLYTRVSETLAEYLINTAIPALDQVRGPFLLKELNRRWQNHKLMVKWVTRTFSYVDRYYVKRYEKPSLEKLGIMAFKEQVYERIKEQVRNAILEMIKRERGGEVVNRSLIKQVLELFAEMGMGQMEVYTTEFESPFLENTAEFYKREAAVWVEDDTFPAFLSKADKALKMEKERAQQYLQTQTQEKLLQVVENEVLHRHQKRMLEKEHSGLVKLLEQNRYESLKTMYRLYSRSTSVDGLEPIATIFRNHVRREGMDIVRLEKGKVASAIANAERSGGNTMLFLKSEMNSSKPEYIHKLLALQEHYTSLVDNCFENHPVFAKAMKEAFERFVNEQIGQTPTALLFANYCDALLNSTGIGSKMDEAEVDVALEKFVNLFSYLTEKDLYQEFCRKQLSKRLLLDRSHSDDAERSLISKLKQRCGTHFTSKLEGMITDIQTSKDQQERFAVSYNKDTMNGESDLPPGQVVVGGIDFSVRVLTTGHWPTYAEHKVIEVPKQLTLCNKAFEEYYQNTTSQRVLRWVHSLGKCTLETSMFTRPPITSLEISVSTHQFCVLNLFNEGDEFTFASILQNVDPSDPDLVKSSVASLTRKYPILIKEPRSKEIRDTDVFRINHNYVANRRRITIPQPVAKVTEAEKEMAKESVVEVRRHGIEAAIVRIMKQNKTMDHEVLVMEVCRLCNQLFQPEPKIVKQRIEELIEREYLARDENNTSTYKYLA